MERVAEILNPRPTVYALAKRQRREEEARIYREEEAAEKRRRHATHEAAHAVIGMVLGLPVAKVDLSAVSFDWSESSAPRSDYIRATVAAREAEMLLLDVPEEEANRAATSDTRHARDALAKAAYEDPEAALQEFREEARALVEEHGEQILKVAAALDHAGELSAEDVAALLEPQEGEADTPRPRPAVTFVPAQEPEPTAASDLFAKRQKKRSPSYGKDIFASKFSRSVA
jgi:hypothetical protein